MSDEPKVEEAVAAVELGVAEKPRRKKMPEVASELRMAKLRVATLTLDLKANRAHERELLKAQAEAADAMRKLQADLAASVDAGEEE